jgi:hypothetical protein
MAKTWVFCLEADYQSNQGNFKSDQPPTPPDDGVFWATGVLGGASPAYTIDQSLFFDTDSNPIFYDGDQVFFASRLQHPPNPGTAGIQDIVVTLGRCRNIEKQAAVGSPIQFPSGKPMCFLNSATVNSGQLVQVTFTSGGPSWKAIGPFTVNKDPGPGQPGRSKFETVVVARVGTNPNPATVPPTPAVIDREFAHDPEWDVDNGL